MYPSIVKRVRRTSSRSFSSSGLIRCLAPQTAADRIHLVGSFNMPTQFRCMECLNLFAANRADQLLDAALQVPRPSATTGLPRARRTLLQRRWTSRRRRPTRLAADGEHVCGARAPGEVETDLIAVPDFDGPTLGASAKPRCNMRQRPRTNRARDNLLD